MLPLPDLDPFIMSDRQIGSGELPKAVDHFDALRLGGPENRKRKMGTRRTCGNAHGRSFGPDPDFESLIGGCTRPRR